MACSPAWFAPAPADAQPLAVCGAGASEGWIAACGSIIDNPRESVANRVRALKFRGLAHYRAGDIERAAADFTAATTLAPNDPEGWINLGMMRQTRGDLDGAVADFDKAIALDPASWVAHVNRGNALRLKSDPKGATAEYDLALGLKPDLGSALRGRGLARQMQGDLPGAIADTTAALKPTRATRKRCWRAATHSGCAARPTRRSPTTRRRPGRHPASRAPGSTGAPS
jgi:tetratricopeptide (TPR) repeat protein